MVTAIFGILDITVIRVIAMLKIVLIFGLLRLLYVSESSDIRVISFTEIIWILQILELKSGNRNIRDKGGGGGGLY
jgi:hypothetical protein